MEINMSGILEACAPKNPLCDPCSAADDAKFGMFEMESAVKYILKKCRSGNSWIHTFSYNEFPTENGEQIGFLNLLCNGWMNPAYPHCSFMVNDEFVKRVTAKNSIFYSARHRELSDREFEFKCIVCGYSLSKEYDPLDPGSVGFPPNWRMADDGPVCNKCK
jgi:hypothetical protein